MISAGDVGRYGYCPLNWKLSREGATGTGSEAGLRAHRELSEQVDALEYYQRTAKHTVQTSFLLALVATSAAALGVELFVLRPEARNALILVLLAVMLLASSLYLVVFTLYYQHRAKELVQTKHIPPGEVAFADSPRNRRLLKSRLFPLQGTPDYVLRSNDDYVPVELKTGKTPPKPYDSHVLQLAAYCQLVGEEFGARPPHGILAYPERQFEVVYTEDLENDLLRTILRIQLAEQTGEAHRNHRSVKRCLGCSRREGCPERLA